MGERRCRMSGLVAESESTSGQLIDIQAVIQRLRMRVNEVETENADLRAQLGTWEGRRDNAQLGAEQERDFYMRRCEALEREIESLRNKPAVGSTHRVVFHSEQTLDGFTTYGYPTKAEHYRPIAQANIPVITGALPAAQPQTAPAPAPSAAPVSAAQADPATRNAGGDYENRGTRGFASRIR